MNVVLTGATSGIGRAALDKLVLHGHQVWILARNDEKAKELESSQPKMIRAVHCDLSDLSSVKKAADRLLSELNNVDLLINNAGGFFGERSLSQQGHEMHFAVNHLGHFYLTQLLMPLLDKFRSKIITVSSDAHRMAKLNLDDIEMVKGYSAMRAYCNVKLMNILFTAELNRRYKSKGIDAFSIHPGVVSSSFAQNTRGLVAFGFRFFSPFMITPEQGANNVLSVMNLASPNTDTAYFKKGREISPAAVAKDEILAKRLWEMSEKFCQF